MTEKKKLPEQKAVYTYKRAPVSLDIGSPLARQSNNLRKRVLPDRLVKNERPKTAAYSFQRVVTMPTADLSDAADAFARRQEQRRQSRQVMPKMPTSYTSRTLRKTGLPATSGRMKAMKAVQRITDEAPLVPVRSGRHNRRRNWFWRLLGLAVLLVVLFSAIYLSLNSASFQVQHVAVEGTKNEALVQAIEKLGIQGQNIFLLNVESFTQKVEAIPQVASATMSKQLPDQITIAIQERQPALLWQTVKGDIYSVDLQGVVIAPLSLTLGVEHLATVTELKPPTITGEQVEAEMHPGQQLSEANIKFASTVLSQLPTMVGVAAFRLYYDGTIYASTKTEAGRNGSKGTFIVDAQQGWKAYLGDASDGNPLTNRLLALREILVLAQKKQQEIATIDLRYGLSPVYTVKA